MFDHFRVSWTIRKGAEPAMERAYRIFSAASCLYRGPIGPSATRPFEFQLLEALIQAFPNECEQSFKNWMGSDNPMLAAYAITGLVYLERPGLLKHVQLPTAGNEIYTQIGCIGCNMAIRDLLKDAAGT